MRTFPDLKSFVFALALLAVPQFAQAQERYTLATKVDPGRRTVFQTVSINSMKIQTRYNGQIVETKDVTNRSIWQGTETVLSTQDGEPTAARFDLDDSCGQETTSPNQNASQDKFPYAGVAVILRRLPGGGISDDFSGNLSRQQQNDLEALLTPDSDDFPDHPVAIGDSWETTAATKAHQFLEKSDDLASFARLDWVKPIEGRPTAQLSLSMAIVQQIEGFMRQESQLSGTEWVDLQTGTIISAHVKGTCDLTGTRDLNGDDGAKGTAAVDGHGTITIDSYSAPAGWAATQPVNSMNQ